MKNEISHDRLKVYLDYFLKKIGNNDGKPKLLNSVWFWNDKKKICELIPENEHKELMSFSQIDFLYRILKPNVKNINDLFLTYLKEQWYDKHNIQSIEYKDFEILVNEATRWKTPFIPVHFRTEDNKNFNTAHIYFPITKSSAIFFVFKPDEEFAKQGITPEKQILWTMAHEVGHALIHFYYFPSYSKENYDEYELFNETIAWNAASDLLMRLGVKQDGLGLLKTLSIERYKEAQRKRINMRENSKKVMSGEEFGA